MTVVVGILNKHSVALAADSAVTIGSKFFNKANKLFRLSNIQPVGIMIHNYGEFMGIPWETIIKLFRKDLGSTELNRVEDYRNRFVQFLRDNHFFISDPTIWKIYVKNLLTELMYRQIESSEIYVQKNITDATLNTFFDSIIANLRTYESYEDFRDFTLQELNAVVDFRLEDGLTEIFAALNIQINITHVLDKYKEVLYLIIQKKGVNLFDSGLVFAGFGKEEIFPALHHINISIIVNNRLRFEYDINDAITHFKTGIIYPFAQTDVIDTILRGIAPSLHKVIIENVTQLIKTNYQQIGQQIAGCDPALSAKLLAVDTNAILAPLVDEIKKLQAQNYLNPLINAISSLSKEDLSEMAESLIYLTYISKKITFADETVAAPVDVAIITKYDGFVWIKRKHYFEANLNPHFFKNI